MNSDDARTSAGRLGLDVGSGVLGPEQVQSLLGLWQDLWAVLDGLPCASGDAWQPVEV